MYCTLSSEHYHRSPLVQGGLEIEFQVVIEARANMLQARLPRCYLDLVRDLYTEPIEDREVGNLFNFVMTLPPAVVTPQAPVKDKVYIHYCFKKSGYPRNVRSTKEEENTRSYRS